VAEIAGRPTADELVHHVRAALTIADGLKLWDAAAALDHALIALTGTGVMPPDAKCTDCVCALTTHPEMALHLSE